MPPADVALLGIAVVLIGAGALWPRRRRPRSKRNPVDPAPSWRTEQTVPLALLPRAGDEAEPTVALKRLIHGPTRCRNERPWPAGDRSVTGRPHGR